MNEAKITVNYDGPYLITEAESLNNLVFHGDVL